MATLAVISVAVLARAAQREDLFFFFLFFFLQGEFLKLGLHLPTIAKLPEFTHRAEAVGSLGQQDQAQASGGVQ